ncbi:MAG: hypothetical protein ABR571_14370 [Jatrophihabitans sp.]|uniref:hypothetical protein n=1 Tax=Jatrophihabitans sp. TaxID=1932789 RepID=UPI0039103D67
MPSYVCYGLTLQSEIELPELDSRAVGQRSGDGADIVIQFGALSGPSPSAAIVAGGLWRSATACGLAVEDVARFEARDGARIVIDPVPRADERAIRLFLLGTVMGAVMMQRGHLVLHGNGLRMGDACAVVVGHSGTGKSTLAAEFARRGLSVLSDDVVPVDGRGRALPGYPRIKLWEDSLPQFGLAPDGLERVRAEAPKYSVPIAAGDAASLPVRWVYALETHDEPDLTLAPLTGIAKFALLSEHTYRRQLLVGEAAVWQHAQLCATVGEQAQIARILRPAGTMTPAATADFILNDIETKHGARSGLR